MSKNIIKFSLGSIIVLFFSCLIKESKTCSDAEIGKETYNERCLSCHLPRKSITPHSPSLIQMSELSDSAFSTGFDVIKDDSHHPGFLRDIMEAEEMYCLIQYIRNYRNEKVIP